MVGSDFACVTRFVMWTTTRSDHGGCRAAGQPPWHSPRLPWPFLGSPVRANVRFQRYRPKRAAPLSGCFVHLKLNSMYRSDAETKLFRHLDDAFPRAQRFARGGLRGFINPWPPEGRAVLIG
jgi:hypothetical protein